MLFSIILIFILSAYIPYKMQSKFLPHKYIMSRSRQDSCANICIIRSAIQGNFIFQLFVSYNKMFQLLYYLGIPPTVRELKIPDCDVLCPFDQFLELMSDVLPSDEELICDKRQTPDYANIEYPAAIQRVIYSLVRSSTTRKNNRL